MKMFCIQCIFIAFTNDSRRNRKLSGCISISGAKNSVVALIPAAILTDGVVEILNTSESSTENRKNQKTSNTIYPVELQRKTYTKTIQTYPYCK